MTLEHSAACHANDMYQCRSCSPESEIPCLLVKRFHLVSPGLAFKIPHFQFSFQNIRRMVCAWNLDSISLRSCCCLIRLPMHMLQGFQLFWVPHFSTDMDHRVFLMHGHHWYAKLSTCYTLQMPWTTPQDGLVGRRPTLNIVMMLINHGQTYLCAGSTVLGMQKFEIPQSLMHYLPKDALNLKHFAKKRSRQLAPVEVFVKPAAAASCQHDDQHELQQEQGPPRPGSLVAWIGLHLLVGATRWPGRRTKAW